MEDTICKELTRTDFPSEITAIYTQHLSLKLLTISLSTWSIFSLNLPLDAPLCSQRTQNLPAKNTPQPSARTAKPRYGFVPEGRSSSFPNTLHQDKDHHLNFRRDVGKNTGKREQADVHSERQHSTISKTLPRPQRTQQLLQDRACMCRMSKRRQKRQQNLEVLSTLPVFFLKSTTFTAFS